MTTRSKTGAADASRTSKAARGGRGKPSASKIAGQRKPLAGAAVVRQPVPRTPADSCDTPSEIDRLSTMPIGELQQLYAEVLSERTRCSNRTHLVRKIMEAAVPIAPSAVDVLASLLDGPRTAAGASGRLSSEPPVAGRPGKIGGATTSEPSSTDTAAAGTQQIAIGACQRPPKWSHPRTASGEPLFTVIAPEPCHRDRKFAHPEPMRFGSPRRSRG